MISVDLDKIVTAKGLQAHLASILFEVEEEEKTYIITKQGKPQAALINVDYLLELTGQKNLATTEYDRYDVKPARTEAGEIDLVPGDSPEKSEKPDFAPSPRQLDKIEAAEIISKPEVSDELAKTEPIEPAVEAPSQLADLSSISEAEPDSNEDPYAVIDEETPKPAEKIEFPVPPVEAPPEAQSETPEVKPSEQQYDLNGLPIPGQPDATDQVANSNIEDALSKLQRPITNDKT